MKKIYSIITGQLCEGTMSELEATDDWKTINQANDAIALMKHLKEICYTDNANKTNPHVGFCLKMRKLLNNRQDNNISLVNSFVNRIRKVELTSTYRIPQSRVSILLHELVLLL